MFNNIQNTRRQINNDGVNVSNLFQYVDVKNKGYIDAEDIQDLLEEKRIECDQRILKGIMKIFRKRLSDKISYQDF
jgi:Ca2+-binding EF-hand superfamily protein